MRLPASRTLRRRPRLPHPVFWRAPRDGTVGLRNPASCAPIRERGNQVFGERLRATTGLSDDTTAAEDFFPNDDYFPDIDNLFDDMVAPDNTGKQLGSSSSTPHVGSSSSVSYISSSSVPFVFLLLLLQIMVESLLLEISLNMLFSSSLLVCVTSLFCLSIVMIYLLLLWIKLYGKLLIYSTGQLRKVMNKSSSAARQA